MRTVATRIGRTVPEHFEGTVRAVWRRACAISLDRPSHAEKGVALVTFVRDDVPMTAASIQLRVGADFDFSASEIQAGDRVVCDGSAIVVHSESGEPTVEGLRSAAAYDGFAPAMRCGSIDPSHLEAVVAAARRHRSATCGHSVLGGESAERCDALLQRLSLGASAGDGDVAARAARSLVGLGPGLTPSGDDILCGFMLGRGLFGSGDGTADAAVRSVAADAARLTTDVSAVQLELAARGRFGEAILGVAEALCGEHARPMIASISRCLAQGATSGADCLLGLAAGIRAGSHRRSDACLPIQ